MAKKQYLDLKGLTMYDEQIKAYIDGEIDAIPSDVFVVNVTGNDTDGYTTDKTFAEAEEAIAAGKCILAKNGANRYQLVNYSEGKIITFSLSINIGVAVINTILWNNATGKITVARSELQSSSARVTVLSSSSTHPQYPSAKAVVDYVGTQISSHTHDDIYYTEAEIDAKLSTVNTSISNITSGSTPVKEAEHAANADSATNANHATTADSATTAGSATKATQDGNGKEISSTYETKTDASAKLEEAKAYADSVSSSAANTVKNDLLNGAGAAYDTLKELGDLIDENVSAIDALEAVAANKKDKDFIVQISGNETDGYVADKTFDEIVEAANNGSTLYAITSSMVKYEFNRASNTNAWFNSYTPNNMMYQTITIKSDNTVSLTSKNIAATQYFYGGVKAATKTDADTVEAKIGADGKLYVPTYPSLDEYYTESEVDGIIADLNASIDSLDTGKADTEHTHEIADVTNLQATLDEIDVNIDTLLANKQIINISDQVINGSFNFNGIDGGLYWTDSSTYISIASNGGEAGLFLVNKLTNTMAQVFCPISGHMYLVNNGIGSLLFERLNTKNTYNDLTTTDKTVLGAINELDSELASHNHAIADVTNLQSTLDGKANQSALDSVSSVANEAKAATAANTQSITANTSSINTHTSQISALQGLVGDGFEAIPTASITALFA